MHVVDHEAHGCRRPPPHGVAHRGRIGRLVGRARDHAGGSVTALRTDRGHHVAGQHDAVGVTLLEAGPDVPTPSRKPVLGDSLGQQRCLAQAGPSTTDVTRCSQRPTRGAQQPRSGERAGPRLGWLEPERATYVDRHPKSVAPARLANRTLGSLRAR